MGQYIEPAPPSKGKGSLVDYHLVMLVLQHSHSGSMVTYVSYEIRNIFSQMTRQCSQIRYKPAVYPDYLIKKTLYMKVKLKINFANSLSKTVCT